jgi:hypothetical protein
MNTARRMGARSRSVIVNDGGLALARNAQRVVQQFATYFQTKMRPGGPIATRDPPPRRTPGLATNISRTLRHGLF